MQLNKSQVIFNPEKHEYTLNGVLLEGITGMISRQLFPDKYKAVPQYIMDKAAERGSMIHESCELFDDMGIEPNLEEVIRYKDMKEQFKLNYECSEYLVSDNEHFASCIDKVYRVSEDTFDLADIKTTYKLDTEYVSWQLSIYAYLFEMQNPECKVNNLFAIWLRGEESKLVKVKRIAKDRIIELMACELAGTLYKSEPNYSLPQKYINIEDEIKNIDEQCKFWADKKKELTEGVMQEMVKAGVYEWKSQSIVFTRKKDSIRKGFDTKKFEKENPDLYAKYIKESPVVGSVTLKVI